MKRRVLVIWVAVLWGIVLFAAVGGATYAWFTFNSATNVEPVSSTVSSGEIALLISTDPDGEFAVECVLPQSISGDLNPISTSDLVDFYTAVQQNRSGITISYKDADDLVDDDTIHGTVYLKSLDNDCDVYLYRPGMDFGEDAQLLAALRLGMKITTESGTETYIFSLSDMGNTLGASAKQTTSRGGVVVGGISSGGNPTYVDNPSRGMGNYFAIPPTNASDRPKAGTSALCRLRANEIGTVEYWLYLEGCDENCINAVQEREAVLQLSFAGIKVTSRADE